MTNHYPKWMFKKEKEEHPLSNISEPNLFRDIFPYDEVPRVEFEETIVPLSPAEEIWITDTTFRDGQQSRPPYSVEQIVKIYDLLHELGGPNGIIKQSEFFIYTDKDREAVEKCLAKGYDYPEVTSWIRANPKDFEIVKSMGLKETGMLTSISDYHIFIKFGKTRQEVIDDFIKVVEAAASEGLKAIRCHFEDITRADFWGCVIPFAERLMKFSIDNNFYIKIRLCDTMGYGVPWPEAALPRGIPKMIYYLKKELGITSDRLEWHGHNDFHLVLINPLTAWLYGCSAANSSLFGIGERCGNPPLEALCIHYAGLTGKTNGMNLQVITELADYFRSIGVNIPDNYPFVGRYFNVTSAGIHADGVLKNEEIYNIFDTAKVLNRPYGIAVTDKSGVSGIALWFNQYLKLTGDKAIDKKHPGVAEIYKWVMAEYDKRRTTSISPEELIELGKKYLPEYFK
ncbi:MAG: 2-isopropylmalate synthase [bacterium]